MKFRQFFVLTAALFCFSSLANAQATRQEEREILVGGSPAKGIATLLSGPSGWVEQSVPCSGQVREYTTQDGKSWGKACFNSPGLWLINAEAEAEAEQGSIPQGPSGSYVSPGQGSITWSSQQRVTTPVPQGRVVYVQQPQPTPTQYVREEGGIFPTILGALTGGLLGSQVGKGDGNTTAIVLGTVGGAVIGNELGSRTVAVQGQGGYAQPPWQCQEYYSTGGGGVQRSCNRQTTYQKPPFSLGDLFH